MNMKKVFFENSLGNETMEALGFKTVEALEQELELLTKDAGEDKIYLSYNG